MNTKLQSVTCEKDKGAHLRPSFRSAMVPFFTFIRCTRMQKLFMDPYTCSGRYRIS